MGNLGHGAVLVRRALPLSHCRTGCRRVGAQGGGGWELRPAAELSLETAVNYIS